MSATLQDQRWDRMLTLYEKCKALMILAEETDPQASTFLQPTVELRHALEHIMRSVAAKRQQGEMQDEVALRHLDKAFGHIARAFFDVADWMTVVLRERLMRLLGKYPPDVIAKSLPEYYKEIRPRLDEVTTELVTLRADKAPVDLWQSFDRYEAVIHELLQFLSKAERSLPALTAALQDSRKRRVAQSVFVALLSALAGALITWLLSNVIK